MQGTENRPQSNNPNQTPSSRSVRILLADDDAVIRGMVGGLLRRWGYEPEIVSDGEAAWAILDSDTPPDLAILDWVMPALDGIEVTRRLREKYPLRTLHVILLTAKGDSADAVYGFGAGADDYIPKQFDQMELRARIKVGERIVLMQRALEQRVRELEAAASRIGQLEGILPICSYCKNVRDDKDYWQQVESYISDRSNAIFSHSICPACYEKHVAGEIERFKREREQMKQREADRQP